MIFKEVSAFLKAVKKIEGEFLSIDLGTKKTGIALSIYQGKMAIPYGVIYEVSKAKLLWEILSLMEKKDCKYIVLGFPFGWESSFSGMRTSQFAALLSHEGFPILLYDENESSVRVKQIVNDIKGKITRKEKQKYDANVAAFILANALDEINLNILC